MEREAGVGKARAPPRAAGAGTLDAVEGVDDGVGVAPLVAGIGAPPPPNYSKQSIENFIRIDFFFFTRS